MAFFEPPGGFQIYNSYVTDPSYRGLMLAGFAGLLGVGVAYQCPTFIRYSLINRRLGDGGYFFRERWNEVVPSECDDGDSDDEKLVSEKDSRNYPPRTTTSRWSAGRPIPALLRPLYGIHAIWKSSSQYRLAVPVFWNRNRSRQRKRSLHLPLSNGQIVTVLATAGILLAGILPEQQLLFNANRLGFIALGLLPIIFLMSMKSASPLALLLGRSYEKLNFLHRWLGRFLLVVVLAHMALWVNDWRATSDQYALDMLKGDKERYGLLALSFLLLLAFTSAAPIRRWAYHLFFTLHVIGFVGLVVAISYHTPYSYSWTGYAVCAIYGTDLVARACHARIREVEIEAMRNPDGDPSGMTRITVRDLTTGWRAGQHVQLRVFFAYSRRSGWNPLAGLGGIESHPFSIAQAPPHISVLPQHAAGRGFRLYARAIGKSSWTADLCEHAERSSEHQFRIAQLSTSPEKNIDGKDSDSVVLKPLGQSVHPVYAIGMLDGPYGGLGYTQPDTNETVLLVACGSGMTFILACLDEIVGRTLRSMRGARTRVIDVVWIVREACHLSWFSDTLQQLQRHAEESGLLSMQIRAYVTCTSPDAAENVRCACDDGQGGSLEPCCCTTPAGTGMLGTQITSTASSIEVIYTRPSLPTILRDVIKSAINPCDSCADCKCATYGGDGTCAGVCDSGGISQKLEDSNKHEPRSWRRDAPTSATRKVSTFTIGELAEADSITPQGCCKSSRATEGKKTHVAPSCCKSRFNSDTAAVAATTPDLACKCSGIDKATLACSCSSATLSPAGPSGCRCSTLDLALPTTGQSCCSRKTGSRVGLDADITQLDNATATQYPPSRQGQPAEIRTGGLAVVACGPSSMLAELGNAVAGLDVQTQVKIGGVTWFAEGFEV